MLNLKTRIHLQKKDILAIGIVQKLDRPGGSIMHALREALRHLPELVTHFNTDSGRRRFFDDLLIPPLCRTIALSKSDHISCSVAKDLNFDVPGVFDIALEVDATLTKVRCSEP